MKTHLIAASFLSSLLVAQYAAAGHERDYAQPRFFDYAKVIDVEPIIRHVRVAQPRNECWEEEVPVYDHGYRSATPMIIGGIIGGVVGHTMGKGRGKDVATVAGTVLGGSIGRDIGRSSSHSGDYRTVAREQCRVVEDYEEHERIEGYNVTYRYKGEDYVTRMDREPGSRIRVAVSVEPAE